MAKEQKIPLDAVPGKPKKGKKQKYWSRKPKNGNSADLAKVAELIVEVAKRL